MNIPFLGEEEGKWNSPFNGAKGVGEVSPWLAASRTYAYSFEQQFPNFLLLQTPLQGS